MSVTYKLHRDAGLIETRCAGSVTLNEVLRHFQELEADPSTPERLDVILDLDAVTSIPETDHLRAVTQMVNRLTAKVRWGACAIIARRDVLFGMSRMFEVFAEGLFARTHVFRERKAAESWLASTRSPESRDPGGAR